MEKSEKISNVADYEVENIKWATCQVPEGSLILSPLASEEKCKKLYKDWMEKTFKNKKEK